MSRRVAVAGVGSRVTDGTVGLALEPITCRLVAISGRGERADLRRPKVEAKVATVSKMTITLTAGTRDGGGAKAAEGVQVLDGGMLTAEEEVRGLPVASGARETILQPRSSLERKGVKRRREVGSGEKDAG